MVRTIRSHKVPIVLAVLALALFGLVQVVLGGGIDPNDKWAWSTNAGWINFDPLCTGCDGVAVYSDHLEGYAWGENIGWIRMGSYAGGGAHTYANTTAGDYGVNNDGTGTLSGYAWGTNAGWINFAGVTIDPATGDFDGYAWGENIGWIHFRYDAPAYRVNTGWRAQAPVITSAHGTTFTVGAAWTFTVTATGVPTPTLVYSGTLPTGVTFSDNGDGTAFLGGTPEMGAGGVYPLTFTAGNGVPPDTTQPFTLTVHEAPSFTSTPIATATQDAPYTYTVTVKDPNLVHGDVLTITAPTLLSWLAFTQTGALTATLTGTPANADVGEHAVELVVTDRAGLSDTQAFTLTVANLNDPPEFTSRPIATATQDAPYTYTVTTDDPDLIHGDVLTITAPTLPSWLTFTDHGDGAATLSGTPAGLGNYQVLLRVTDRSGAFAEQSLTVTVAEKPRYQIFLPLVLRVTP